MISIVNWCNRASMGGKKSSIHGGQRPSIIGFESIFMVLSSPLFNILAQREETRVTFCQMLFIPLKLMNCIRNSLTKLYKHVHVLPNIGIHQISADGTGLSAGRQSTPASRCHLQLQGWARWQYALENENVVAQRVGTFKYCWSAPSNDIYLFARHGQLFSK
jgi:hypothetical protein